MPTSGGEETLVEKGIYYLDTTAVPAIAFFDFTSRHATRVVELQTRPAREATGLAASPDGRTILYTQLDALTRDIVLVDNVQ
jgi:hypothetical protein